MGPPCAARGTRRKRVGDDTHRRGACHYLDARTVTVAYVVGRGCRFKDVVRTSGYEKIILPISVEGRGCRTVQGEREKRWTGGTAPKYFLNDEIPHSG